MQWTLLENPETLSRVACSRVLELASEAIAKRRAFRVVLAGGATPEHCYRLLSHSTGDWQNWHIYFGDERCLPMDHPDRNSNMVARSLTDRVPIPPAQIFPIPAELGADIAAFRYGKTIREALPLDLALLGLGEDGHTASLFPGYDLGQGLLAVPVHQAPKPPADRVSLTPLALAGCRRLLFLVSGANKRGAIADWRAGKKLPASRVASGRKAEILVDRGAWGPQGSGIP